MKQRVYLFQRVCYLLQTVCYFFQRVYCLFQSVYYLLQSVCYLLQSVYSSLLVTPRGGGRKCQPSCDPAGHNHGYFAILTFPVRQQLLRNPHLKHQPKVDLNTSKITHPPPKTDLESMTRSFRAEVMKGNLKPPAEQDRL